MPAANGTDDAPTAQGMGGKTDNVTPEGTHAAVSHQQPLHCALHSKHDTDEKMSQAVVFKNTIFTYTQQKCHKGFRATVYFYQIQNNLEFPQAA